MILGKEEKRNNHEEITQQASGYQPLFRKIDLLMGELKTSKTALLRSNNHLCPERKNVTRWESIKCAHFLRDGAPDSILNSPDQKLGYADRVLLAGQQEKRACLEKSKYRSKKHVTSQSNISERLLSRAKLIMNYLRKCMNPRILICCSC